MTRVDLDAVERHIEPFNGCPECQVRELVAELRAAREVVRLAPRPPRVLTDREEQAYLKALAAYDQVVAS